MPRYIDVDALIADVRKHSESYFADDFAREWVDKQPTADVAPVLRGRWIAHSDDDDMTCSSCGDDACICVMGKNVTTKKHYCPSCGAIMDLEDNNDGTIH